MSVRVTGPATAALYDSVTGLAFGPTFESDEAALDFLQHLEDIGERDPRVIPSGDLAQLHAEWAQEREGNGWPGNETRLAGSTA